MGFSKLAKTNDNSIHNGTRFVSRYIANFLHFFCTRRRCILLAYSGTSYLTFDKAHDYTPLQLFAHPPGERKHNFIDNKGALKDL